jgi:Cu+-exporting ATPase
MVGVGRAARMGVLIRNAEALEQFEKVDTLVLDKTDTLTEGRPAVIAVKAVSGFDEREMIRLGASLEQPSEHPLALAIVKAAKDRNITLATPFDFDSPTGKGVVGAVEGRKVALGAERYLRELGVDASPLADVAETLRRDGATAIYVAIDGVAAGVFGIADPIKPSTPPPLPPCAPAASAWSC